jgi:hypothetical protein
MKIDKTILKVAMKYQRKFVSKEKGHIKTNNMY